MPALRRFAAAFDREFDLAPEAPETPRENRVRFALPPKIHNVLLTSNVEGSFIAMIALRRNIAGSNDEYDRPLSPNGDKPPKRQGRSPFPPLVSEGAL